MPRWGKRFTCNVAVPAERGYVMRQQPAAALVVRVSRLQNATRVRAGALQQLQEASAALPIKVTGVLNWLAVSGVEYVRWGGSQQ